MVGKGVHDFKTCNQWGTINHKSRPRIHQYPNKMSNPFERPPASPGQSETGKSDATPRPTVPSVHANLAIGTRVRCRQPGGQFRFTGQVTARNEVDGTYDVEYEDGDTESKVAPTRIMPVTMYASMADAELAQLTTELEAIERSNPPTDGGGGQGAGAGAGMHAVGAGGGVEDAPRPRASPPAQVKPSGLKKFKRAAKTVMAVGSMTIERHDFSVGTKVKCRQPGGQFRFEGHVSACNLDGTYDVKYIDGDTESKVDSSRVEAASIYGSLRL